MVSLTVSSGGLPRVAVVTGSGSGMGRELVRQLSADGCDVATRDVLLDNAEETAAICELIVDIMGPNILLSMTQAIVRPSTDRFPGYIHTDGGEALREVRVSETSRPLALKALYLLSDVAGTDAGAFTVFPGSHLRPFPARLDPPLTPRTPGAVQLPGRAGDCYLVSHSLWHGPSANLSGRARKTLLYNYCQLFLRSYDHHDVSPAASQATARQRRLLGDLGYDFRPGSYFYVPLDQQQVMFRSDG